MSGDVTPYFRLGPDRKVCVRALASNNPKQFDDVETYYALFQGTFDLGSKKWTSTDARLIDSEQSDALESAYQDNFDQHDRRCRSSESTRELYRLGVFIRRGKSGLPG